MTIPVRYLSNPYGALLLGVGADRVSRTESRVQMILSSLSVFIFFARIQISRNGTAHVVFGYYKKSDTLSAPYGQHINNPRADLAQLLRDPSSWKPWELSIPAENVER